MTTLFIVKFVQYIIAAVKNKNWTALLNVVLNLITEAEEKFDNGADRKEWVLSMVESMSNSINCDVDVEQISEMIDALCSMSKVVNASK